MESPERRKQRAPLLVFVTGVPGSGKTLQCGNLAANLGFKHISIREILLSEVKSGSEIGLTIEKTLHAHSLVSKELLVPLLWKALSNLKAKLVLIDGFPREVNQAVYLEQLGVPISRILYFECEGDEIPLKRLAGQEDASSEDLWQRIQVYRSQIDPVLKLYDQFGVTRRVNCIGTHKEVYSRALAALRPAIICIIGPIGAGKSCLARRLGGKYGFDRVEVKPETQSPTKRLNSDEALAESLRKTFKLRLQANHIVLDGFPDTLAQARMLDSVSETHPSLVISISCSKDSALQRFSKMDRRAGEYLAPISLSKQYFQHESKPLSLYYSRTIRKSFHIIDSELGSSEEIAKLAEAVVQPEVVIVRGEVSERFLSFLERKMGFRLVNATNLMRLWRKARTVLGVEDEKSLSDDPELIPLLKPILYSSLTHSKFALYNFALTSFRLFSEFESSIAAVKCCFFLHKTKGGMSSDPVSVELWARHKLVFVPVERVTGWQRLAFREGDTYRRALSDYQHPNKAKIVFIYGLKYGGKTTTAHTLVKDFAFTLGSYTSIMDCARNRLLDKREPTFTDFATEFQSFIHQNPGTRFVFDGLPDDSILSAPGGPSFPDVILTEEDLQSSRSHLVQLAARWEKLLSDFLSDHILALLHTNISLDIALSRCAKMHGDVSDDQQREIEASNVLAFYLSERRLASDKSRVRVDTSSRQGAARCLEAEFRRRVVLVRSQFSDDSLTYLRWFAFRHRVTLLNWPDFESPSPCITPQELFKAYYATAISPLSATILICSYPFLNVSDPPPGLHFHSLLGIESAFGRLHGLLSISHQDSAEDLTHESLPVRQRKQEFSEVASLLEEQTSTNTSVLPLLDSSPMWNQYRTAGLTLVFQYYGGEKAKFERVRTEKGEVKVRLERILKEMVEPGEKRLNIQFIVQGEDECSVGEEIRTVEMTPDIEYFEQLPLDISSLGNYSQRIAQDFHNQSALAFHTAHLKYFTVPFSCFFDNFKPILDSLNITITLGLRKAIRAVVDPSHTASVSVPELDSFFALWEDTKLRDELLQTAKRLDVEAKTRGDTIGYKLLFVVVRTQADPVTRVKSFEKGDVVVITHEGCPQSQRFCADRVTYVGKSSPLQTNDIVFREAETRIKTHHFSILSKRSGYFLVDGGTPDGVKIQIEDFPIVLFPQAVLFFGGNKCVVLATPTAPTPPSSEFIHIMDYHTHTLSPNPASSPSLLLEFQSGPLFGRSFTLDPSEKEIFTVGSAEDSDIVLADLTAATHAWLLHGDYGWAVVDMQSNDLTWIAVNLFERTKAGRASPPLRVRNGMVVSVAGTHWKCVFKSDINFRVQMSDFVEVRCMEFWEVYEVDGKIGSGAYGQVFRCRHKGTGLISAVKILPKSKVDTSQLFEIVSLKRLDHPNVLRVLDIIDDSHNLYIVTEMLYGGELFNRIVAMKRFSEAEAADVMKQIMAGVNFIHSRSVIHRDIKPENLLYESDAPDSALKLIDFGTARVVLPSYKVSERIGTPYYMAPEVIKGKYDAKCDVWSCGVVLYILLCGRPPFPGKNEQEIFHLIQSSPPTFSESSWKLISSPAKSLVKEMLSMDPRHRPTALEVLTNPWLNLQAHGVDYSKPLAEKAFSNLKNFNASNKLQQAIMMFIANNLLSEEEKRYSMQLFTEMDKDGSGLLSKEELRAGFRQVHFELSDSQIESVMSELDANMSGLIDYSEFLTGVTSMAALLSREHLNTMFSMFDADGSGDITACELKALLGQSEEKWMALLEQVDNNKDGKIDLIEFKTLMLSYIE